MFVGLFRSGLVHTYKWLTLFAASQVCEFLIFAWIPAGTDAYAIAYFSAQPFLWLLKALMTLEVFQVALKAHPAIASVSRRAVGFSVAAALTLALATLAFEYSPVSPYPILELFLVLERVVHASLFLFVLLLLIGLLWFPVPLSRNALVHAAIFTVFFGMKTVVMLSRNIMGPSFDTATNQTVRALSIVCYLCWAIFLTETGENSTVKSGFSRNPGDTAKLVDQLEALNRIMAGSARK